MQTQPLRPPIATLVAVEVALPLQAPVPEAPVPEAPVVREPALPTPGYTRHSLGVIEADRDRRLQQRGSRGRRRRTEAAPAHPRLSAALEGERTGRA
jgi:hypothetical protein